MILYSPKTNYSLDDSYIDDFELDNKNDEDDNNLNLTDHNNIRLNRTYSDDMILRQDTIQKRIYFNGHIKKNGNVVIIILMMMILIYMMKNLLYIVIICKKDVNVLYIMPLIKN